MSKPVKSKSERAVIVTTEDVGSPQDIYATAIEKLNLARSALLSAQARAVLLLGDWDKCRCAAEAVAALPSDATYQQVNAAAWGGLAVASRLSFEAANTASIRAVDSEMDAAHEVNAIVVAARKPVQP